MLEDVEHLLWLAALQDYSVNRERAEQLAAELRETRAFLRITRPAARRPASPTLCR